MSSQRLIRSYGEVRKSAIPPPIPVAPPKRVSIHPSYDVYPNQDGKDQSSQYAVSINPISNHGDQKNSMDHIHVDTINSNRESQRNPQTLAEVRIPDSIIHDHRPDSMHNAVTSKDAVYVIGHDATKFFKTPTLFNWVHLCYHVYETTFFWFLVCALCLAEPILCCTRKPGSTINVNYTLQCLVLIVSAVLLVIQIYAGVSIIRRKKRRDLEDLSVFILEKGHSVKLLSNHVIDKSYRIVKNGSASGNGTDNGLSWKDKDGNIETAEIIENFDEWKVKGLLNDITSELWTVITTGSVFLESVCIMGGTIFIYYRPGIAALRCFRVLRILYFHQLPRDIIYKMEKAWYYSLCIDFTYFGFSQGPYSLWRIPNPLQVVEFQLVERACKFASGALTSLATEMFFLSRATKGGVVLMFLLFYTAFTVGMSIFYEVFDEPFVLASTERTNCVSVGMCTLLMLRMTFYDGEGLDFLTQLSENHKFLFVVAMVYLCVTAFGIFNGLIGVFGQIFNKESESHFSLNSHPMKHFKGYSQRYIEQRGEANVRAPSKGGRELQVGDVVRYRSSFNSNRASQDALRGTPNLPMDGEFNGLVGKITHVDMHVEENNQNQPVLGARCELVKQPQSDTDQNNSVHVAYERVKTTQVFDADSSKSRSSVTSMKNRHGANALADTHKGHKWGITYSVQFQDRDHIERFKVEFFPSPLNLDPDNIILHYICRGDLYDRNALPPRDQDFQPLMGCLELMTVNTTTEERLCELEEQLLHGSNSENGNMSNIKIDALQAKLDKIEALETKIKMMDSKLDQLLNLLTDDS